MSNPEIDQNSETLKPLKKAGVPDWVVPLDEIKGAPEELFKRMRAEYRDLAPAWVALFESSPDAMTGDDAEVLNYALFFAAEFKDERFSTALLRLLKREDDLLEFLFGDFLTVVMDECVARICSADLEGIKALALDANADRYARWTALDSFKALLWDDYYSAERLKEELRDVIARLEDTELWDAITSLVTALGWVEFEKELLEASKAGYLEEGIFGDEEDVREAIENNRGHEDGSERPVFDAVTILVDYWKWSKQMEKEIARADEMRMIEEGEAGWDWDRAADRIETPEGYALDEGGGLMRDAEKVGRNDPCPCGSGKKFKKCCA